MNKHRKFENSSLIIERTTVQVSDDTGRIAMLEKRTIGNASDDHNTAEELTRFVYSNHLQSASLELDETGDVISYEEYHPYDTTSYQAMNASIHAVAKRYRYTGKERDEESGLYYHGARYYIPWLGRWASCDPINSENYNLQNGYGLEKNLERGFLVLTASPYEYSYDNPVVYNDPSGEQPPPNKARDGGVVSWFGDNGSNNTLLPFEKNPIKPGRNEKEAMAVVDAIQLGTIDKHGNDEMFSKAGWFSEFQKLNGSTSIYFEKQYITDTKGDPNNKFNMYVNIKGSTLYVDESKASYYNNFESFVTYELLTNFKKGTGAENYVFPTNGIISSKFLEADVFKTALAEFNSGKDVVKQQFGFGGAELTRDVLRTGSFVGSITGMVGSAEITFSPTKLGVHVTIFNITSLYSGDLPKDIYGILASGNASNKQKIKDNHSAISYVRKPNQKTPYGNISQTFNLFIPWSSPLLTRKKQ